jgi:CRP-like cAMP-binding protein
VSASRARQIGEPAAALAASPHDLGAWQRLAAALARAGKPKPAAGAFAALGRAASDLGQVGLAVACARWLTQARRTDEADALLEAIAAAHCRGSARIDGSSRPRPPAPPSPAAEPAELPATVDEALALAERAVAAATEAAAERAPDTLPPTPLIRVLEPDEFRELCAVMTLQQRRDRQVVVDVGQPARALYWIARGTVRVSRDDLELGELRANSFFGEIALVGGTTRTARVTCDGDVWLLEIPADSLEQAAARAPKLARVLARYARSRLLANVMRTSELFSRLSEDERQTLLPRFSTRMFGPGEAIVEKGADNDTLFVLVSGRCEVRRDGDDLVTLGVGDGVGEASLLARKPASADVVATEPTVMLCLSRADFDDIAVEHPALLAEVYKLLVEREDASADAIVHDAEDLII